MSAEKFIDKMWPENKLALGVKEQWAELMEQYAKEANQSKEEKSELSFDLEPAIQKGEIVLWHFDDNTRSRFVEVKAVNYIDKNKPLGVWLGGGWISFDMIERLPNQPKELDNFKECAENSKFEQLVPSSDIDKLIFDQPKEKPQQQSVDVRRFLDSIGITKSYQTITNDKWEDISVEDILDLFANTLNQDKLIEAAELMIERLKGLKMNRHVNVELAEPIYKLKEALKWEI